MDFNKLFNGEIYLAYNVNTISNTLDLIEGTRRAIIILKKMYEIRYL